MAMGGEVSKPGSVEPRVREPRQPPLAIAFGREAGKWALMSVVLAPRCLKSVLVCL